MLWNENLIRKGKDEGVLPQWTLKSKKWLQVPAVVPRIDKELPTNGTLRKPERQAEKAARREREATSKFRGLLLKFELLVWRVGPWPDSSFASFYFNSVTNGIKLLVLSLLINWYRLYSFENVQLFYFNLILPPVVSDTMQIEQWDLLRGTGR